MTYEKRFCPDCGQSTYLNATRCSCGHSFIGERIPILIEPDSKLLGIIIYGSFSLLCGILMGIYCATFYLWPPASKFGNILFYMAKNDTNYSMTVRFLFGLPLGILSAYLFLKKYAFLKKN